MMDQSTYNFLIGCVICFISYGSGVVVTAAFAIKKYSRKIDKAGNTAASHFDKLVEIQQILQNETYRSSKDTALKELERYFKMCKDPSYVDPEDRNLAKEYPPFASERAFYREQRVWELS